MRYRFAALVLLLLCTTSHAQESKITPSAARSLEELETQIREILSENNIPAAGITLVDREKIIWTAGIGTADLASGRAATADTLFRVGSITKSFTSLAVLRFVEEGHVHLDDRVRDLIPDVSFENRWWESDPILLSHLLEHTTGFDDLHLTEYAYNQGDPPTTLSEGLAFHPHSRTSRWRPGRYMSYSNAGPAMAAAILEKISGRSADKILVEDVLRPLGMTTATLFQPAGSALATGYEGDGTPGFYWHISMRPSGGLNASPRQMASLVRMLLNRGTVDGIPIWQPSSIERMELPQTTAAARAGLAAGYGLSNFVTQGGGFLWHGHSGGVNTFRADYGYNREHGIGFFAVINTANRRALGEIRDALCRYLTRDLEPSPEPAAEISADDLAKVAGYYLDFTPRQEFGRFLNGYFGIARVRQQEGHLYVGSPMGPGDPLVPLGGNRFRTEDDAQASWIFVPNTEDGDLLLGDRNLRRISPLFAWLQWIITAFCLILMLTSVLFALVWAPRLAFHRLRGTALPFSRASLSWRFFPLLATITLILSFTFLVIGLTGNILLLGAPTFLSIGFTFGTLTYALLSLLSAVHWWKTRQSEGHRGVRFHSLLVTLAHLIAVVALAWWGLLGARTWS